MYPADSHFSFAGTSPYIPVEIMEPQHVGAAVIADIAAWAATRAS
ncbi:MAG: hypothetical protein ACRDN0_15270 [Trebonia sp.]